MVFELKNKVALVTGGASGIGLAIVKNLLSSGIKGVTLADINVELAEKVLKELQNEFGSSKVIFVKTDISDVDSFENAFKATLEQFKNVDILFNNAGFGSDINYGRTIDVNVKGTLNGILLGMDKYLKNHKSGEEGLIVNTSSIAGLESTPAMTTYSGTKFAISGLTLSFGHQFHYDNNKVRLFAICPGYTDTAMPKTGGPATLRPDMVKLFFDYLASMKAQSSDFVAKETIKLLGTAKNGSLWIIDESEPAYEFVLPDRKSFKPK